MTMQASEVLDRVQSLLSDSGADRWSRATLLNYLSDAQQYLVAAVRPDANAEARSVAVIVSTSQQSIPSDTFMFLGAVRNMGATGTTPGRAIQNMTLAEKEKSDPAWDSGLEGSEVLQAIADPMTPKTFWITPIIKAGTTLEIAIRVAVMPTALTTETDVLEVHEGYRQFLLYWTASLAIDENTDAGSKNKAAAYRQSALQTISLKMHGDAAGSQSAAGASKA